MEKIYYTHTHTHTCTLTLVDESDFAPIERNITITSESLQNNRVCFEVTIIGDNINEPDETFRVEISANSPDMVQIGQRQATIRIIHDGDCKYLHFRYNLPPKLDNNGTKIA